jgi:DNA-binding GntR family transcriptional regulator
MTTDVPKDDSISPQSATNRPVGANAGSSARMRNIAANANANVGAGAGAGAKARTRQQPRRTALKAPTLMDAIYQEILERLQRGEIGMNHRLLDYEIAEEFECTRMPVRQALMRLVNEGYLVGTTRGFVLVVLTDTDVRDIFEVRRLLEPGAVAAALQALNDDHRKALSAAGRKARRAFEQDSIALMSEANVEFRQIWVNAVENSRLRSTILRFSDHSRQVRFATMNKPGTMKMVADGLQNLLKGFLEQDVVFARAAVTEFIDNAEYQYFLDEHQGTSPKL